MLQVNRNYFQSFIFHIKKSPKDYQRKGEYHTLNDSFSKKKKREKRFETEREREGEKEQKNMNLN